MLSAYKKRPLDFRRKILWNLYSPDLKLLQEQEQRWLEMINADELGIKYYNLKRQASGGNGGANRGKTMKKHGPCTDEHKEKLRRSQMINNSKRRQIIIDGIQYNSLRDAAKSLGVSRKHPKITSA